MIKNISRKQFFLKVALPVVAFVMMVNVIIGLFNNPKHEVIEPQNPVAIAAFDHFISGLGISEPQSEIINIGVNISGVVSEVYVVAGDKVYAGDYLFTIDDREAKSNLDLKLAQYNAASLDAEEKMREFEMYKKISDSRAYSRDEFNKKRINAEVYQQKANQAKAEMDIAAITVDKLTVKSPINGEVLKVDVRVGEFAQAGISSDSLMTVGDLSLMHIRVEIDESSAHLLNPNKPAIAYLRGNPEFKIPLNFVRIEPYIVPKVSISGGNAEKIDTRVLQVIYSFENNLPFKVFVGQQFDVYIET